MQKKATIYYCSVEYHEARIDFFLSRFLEISRTIIDYKIKKKLILVNKNIVFKKSKKVFLNDEIEILEEEKALLGKKNNFFIEVIFEHRDFLIINKPAGILSHKLTNGKCEEYTLVDFALEFWHGDTDDTLIERRGIVHRLDKETTGVMIIAKNQQAMNYFMQQFKLKKIKKEYIAFTEINNKVKDSGIISYNIMRDPFCPIKMTYSIGQGKEAQTEYIIKEKKNNFFIVQCLPLTGRTHQIRVHLSAIGLSIIGDKVYGKKITFIDRCALHARSIQFYYCDQLFEFYIDMHDDMKKLL